MEFCEKCGGMIVIKDGKTACANCGYKPKKRIKVEAFEKMVDLAVKKTKELRKVLK